jgi:hypothetical protein
MKKGKLLGILMIVWVVISLAGCQSAQEQLPAEETDPVVVVVEPEDEVIVEEPVVEEETTEEEPVVEEPEEVIPEEPEKAYVFVNITGLNYRAGPSSDTEILRVLDHQEQLEIVVNEMDEINSEWVHVMDKSGVEGYVYATYVVNEMVKDIARPYHDVDYSAYEKQMDFESNPYVNVKGIYVSGSSAATNIEKFIEIAKNSEINSFIIDIKDDSGKILFPSETAKALLGERYSFHIRDIESLIKKLKDEDIYLIGRLVSFKSPKYAATFPERAIIYKGGGLFKTNDAAYWGSPYDRQLWEYNKDIAEEAIKLGFNEIQFDYVRFPTSGGINLDERLDYRNELGETKTKAVQSYIKYMQEELMDYEAYLSADVYGWTSTAINDVGIGQHWEGISNVIDVISPMFYPSHYGEGIFGFEVPDAHPYEVMNRATEDAVQRNANIDTPAKIRPWIQSFTAGWVTGHISYTMDRVNDQIRALKEFGIDEYMLWNSSNNYNVTGIGVE